MAKNPWTGKGRPGDRKKARRKRGLFNFNYEPKTQIPREINIKNIKVGEGRRALNSGKVKELVQSIDALDLQTPITVRPVSFTRGWKDPDYALVSGLHRLEAMKQLNRPTIVAFVMRDGKEMARMWEISENLHRAELTPLEQSEQVAEWVRLAQQADSISVQVEQKKGRGRPFGGIAKAARALLIKGNTAAAKRAKVNRAIKIDKIHPDAKAAAKKAGLDKNESKLLAIAKEKTKEDQLAKVHELSASKPKATEIGAKEAERIERLLKQFRTSGGLQRAYNSLSDNGANSFIRQIKEERFASKFA